MTDHASTPKKVDAISIGFGPAAIALACAIEDYRESGDPRGDIKIVFLERASKTSWHPELLLAGADINHHPYRDLVTPRNPRSRFSFAMYLKESGRMFDFGLLGRPASRHEWSDYISWAATKVSGSVSYNEHINEIFPSVDGGRLDELHIDTTRERYSTKNLIISSGSTPNVPSQFLPHLGAQVFHTSEFLTRLAALERELPRRWLVVGSGQSASESVLEILSRQTGVHVLSVHRSIGFKLTQLGHFPNQVFSPSQVDYFHKLTLDQRRQYLSQSRSTNYAGIDPDESQKLFSIIYEDRLLGRERLDVKGHSVVETITRSDDRFLVTLNEMYTGERSNHEVDAIVLATGYLQHVVPPLLSNLQPWLRTAPDSGLLIDRDYQIALAEGARPRLFANGLSEQSHGISDGQSFSLMALRAQRILEHLSG